MTETALVPYALLMQQFKAAPPGKLYCVHGSSPGVFRLSLTAAAHALLKDVPITLVDGTNRFDVYYLAEFARRQRPDPGRILEHIFVSRAFTCYQMEAVITERLPAFLKKKRSPIAIIFGLLDTFYDEQAPLFEVQASLQRIIAALRQLKQDNIAVLLASLDVRLASPERNSLFPKLRAAMDQVYTVEEDEEQGLKILLEQQHERLPQRKNDVEKDNRKDAKNSPRAPRSISKYP